MRFGEITLGSGERTGLRPAKIGDYDVQVLIDERSDGTPRPLAILCTPWIEENLLLYARTLWRRRWRGRLLAVELAVPGLRATRDREKAAAAARPGARSGAGEQPGQHSAERSLE